MMGSVFPEEKDERSEPSLSLPCVVCKPGIGPASGPSDVRTPIPDRSSPLLSRKMSILSCVVLGAERTGRVGPFCTGCTLHCTSLDLPSQCQHCNDTPQYQNGKFILTTISSASHLRQRHLQSHPKSISRCFWIIQ